MSIFGWCSRRVAGLALLAELFLCYLAIKEAGAEHAYEYPNRDYLTAPNSAKSSSLWQRSFAYYCLLIHALVFIFPLRSCWALWDISRSLKRMARRKAQKEFKYGYRRRDSSTSLSSSETLTSSKVLSSTSSESGESGESDPEYYGEVDIAPEQEQVIHAIIIPNYKEELDTLRETLEVLASHYQARDTYDVYLGMEHRESNAEFKATSLINEFSLKFRSIDFTLHPANIPGEAAGKGSNVAWAARKLSEKYALPRRKDVIVTSIDADSHLSSTYFAQLNSMHLTFPETATTTLYSVPIIFDRNAHNVPALVRVADIMWAGAGMSGLYHGSTIAPPTSVYSLSLQLVDRVGGWDCDSEAIGEDMHMYLKCFFALNGNLTVRTVLSPVSQSNVTGGGHSKGIRCLITDVRARYKQGLRHLWGSLDSGYVLRKIVELWVERKHTSRAFRPLHNTLNTASDPFVPQSQIDAAGTQASPESGIFSDVVTDTLKSPNYQRIVYLLHRMFEAHFLPLQMTILVFASSIYLWLGNGHADAHQMSWIFTLCNALRALGFLEVVLYLFLYEGFHKICIDAREKEMSDAVLTKGMHFSRRKFRKNLIDYFMVPLVAPLFGSIPSAQAQISHFWTLDLVYSVSKKVTRRRGHSLTQDPEKSTTVDSIV